MRASDVSHQMRNTATPMIAAIANAAYTREDGGAGLGLLSLANIRPTGQPIGRPTHPCVPTVSDA